MDNNRNRRHGRQPGVLPEPAWTQRLFGDTRLAWFWLLARVYVGWLWLDAGQRKLREDAWMDGGLAVKGIWERSLQAPEQGSLPLAYNWYRDIIQFMLNHGWYTWFAPMIAVGQTLLGIALILGLMTGLSAFLGSMLHINSTLASATATNPLLFALAVSLMLAWRTAGWIGLDHWVLPLAGRLWRAKSSDSAQTPTRGHRQPAQVPS